MSKDPAPAKRDFTSNLNQSILTWYYSGFPLKRKKGAQLFARHNGIEILEATDLLIPRELEFYNQIKNDPTFTTKKPFENNKRGTVGAVARDQTGSLAAATSTGGTPRKLPGRVGDTPLMGPGTYADNQLGAASATGWGESIMKVLLSKKSAIIY